jgi:hypothetical protein
VPAQSAPSSNSPTTSTPSSRNRPATVSRSQGLR